MNATNIFKKVVKKIECNDFTRTIILIGIAALTLLLIYNIGKYVGQRVVLIILTGQFVPIKIIRTTLIVNYCAVKQ